MKYFIAKNYLAIPDLTAPSEHCCQINNFRHINEKMHGLRHISPAELQASRLTAIKVIIITRCRFMWGLDYCSLYSVFNVITAFVLRKILHTLTAVKIINNRGT